jgi:DNA-binding transcriptional MocR family regulator
MSPDPEDDIAIDLDNDRPDGPPLYVEIARIFDGRISHAALLPPAHRLATDHGVSTATAWRGLRLLASLGWARHVPGHPYQAIRPAHFLARRRPVPDTA